MATGKGLPMTPLDLDAVQTKAKINVEAHAWVSDGCWCITCRTSRDVLALADEVERLRAQVGYLHIDLDNARRMLAENVLASPQPPAPPEKCEYRSFRVQCTSEFRHAGPHTFFAGKCPVEPEMHRGEHVNITPQFDGVCTWCGIPMKATAPAPPSQKEEKRAMDGVWFGSHVVCLTAGPCERHLRLISTGPHCSACGQSWPCHAAPEVDKPEDQK